MKNLQLNWWQVMAAGLVACGVLTVMGHLSILKPIQRDQHHLAKLRADLAQLQGEKTVLERNLATVHADLETLHTELEDRPIRLEPASHLNNRLASIVDVASSSRLRIDQTQSGERTPGEWFDEIPIRLSGGGSYGDCAAFLHRLKTTLPDVAIVGFDLVGEPENPRSPSSFRFDLDWYASPSLVTASAE